MHHIEKNLYAFNVHYTLESLISGSISLMCTLLLRRIGWCCQRLAINASSALCVNVCDYSV